MEETHSPRSSTIWSSAGEVPAEDTVFDAEVVGTCSSIGITFGQEFVM